MERQFAFIDETGGAGLDLGKPGTSSHFILTAIMVDESKLKEVSEAVIKVRKKHFIHRDIQDEQDIISNPVKSCASLLDGKWNVGDDLDWRMRVIQDLRAIDFRVLAFVIHKDRLSRSGGFRFSDSFVKFLSKHLYRELHLAFPGLKITIDRCGDEQFMKGFQDYVNREFKPNLFEDYTFDISDVRDDEMIQLSDFVSDTVALAYEKSRKTERAAEFIRALREKFVAVKEWPGDYASYLVNLHTEIGTEFDSSIANYSVRLAADYAKKHEEESEPIVKARVRFVEHLLFRLRFDKPGMYIPTHQILAYLNAEVEQAYDKYQLRAKIVAPLRDAGVLIASSRDGYKIPLSEKEVYEFVNHSMTVIQPMLWRLRRCREQIQLATMSGLDVFSKPEYKILQELSPVMDHLGETEDRPLGRRTRI